MNAVVLTTESGRRSGGTECARRRGVAIAERGLDDAGQNHLRDRARTRVGLRGWDVVAGGNGERGTRGGNGGTGARTRGGRVVVGTFSTQAVELFHQFGGRLWATCGRGLSHRRTGRGLSRCLLCVCCNRSLLGGRTRGGQRRRVVRVSVGMIGCARGGGRKIGECERSRLELLLGALHRRDQRRQAEPAPLILDHCKSIAMNKKLILEGGVKV